MRAWSFVPPEPILATWRERLEFRYWVFWVTGPLGLHTGHFLFDDFADYLRSPVVLGAHGLAALIGIGLLGAWLARRLGDRQPAPTSATAQVLRAAGVVYGALLTTVGVKMRRFYLLVVSPLDSVWLARTALQAFPTRAPQVLALLWICELTMSATFLSWIHASGGTPKGDYGLSYTQSRALIRSLDDRPYWNEVIRDWKRGYGPTSWPPKPEPAPPRSPSP